MPNKKKGNRKGANPNRQEQIKSRRRNRRRGPAYGRKTQPLADLPGVMSAAAVAQAKVVRAGEPNMRTFNNGDARIIHREYVQDVVSASAGSPSNFQCTQLPINPGQAVMFPWLSTIAARWESFEINALKFCYETEAPTSLGGTLLLDVDYDASDPAPLTKQQAMVNRGSVRSAPWQPCEHVSLFEDLRKAKSNYVRPGLQPANTDIKEYDIGTLNICTQNVTSNSAVCGELYVEYDITLRTPVYEAAASTSGTMSTQTGTQTAPLAAGVALGAIGITQAGTTTISFTNLVIGQEYVIIYYNASSSGTQTTPVGMTLKTTMESGSQTSVYTYTATATSGSIVVSGAAVGPGNAELIIAQIPISAY